MPEDFATQVSGVSALAEPLRRALYDYVVAQPEPVSRDQAAAGANVARHTAKFHLDKLVEEGLLTTEFRRLGGRTGPGAGRPAKLYRRSDRQLDVTLPARRYELAGQLLAEAVSAAAEGGTPVLEAVTATARRAGRELAGDPAESLGRRGGAERDSREGRDELATVAGVLGRHGYEPRRDEAGVSLANCPFHALAQQHRDLVCGMNLALLHGLLDGLGCRGVAAQLDPAPNRCCVTLAQEPSSPGSDQH